MARADDNAEDAYFGKHIKQAVHAHSLATESAFIFAVQVKLKAAMSI